eukprot:Em0567g4a
MMIVPLLLVVSLSLTKGDTSTTSDLLWPLPRSMSFGTTVYSLQPANFYFTSSGPGGSSNIVKGAFVRYLNLIFKTPSPFYPNGGPASQVLPSLDVYVNSNSEVLSQETNETYTLSITGGVGKLTAFTVYGALRGLETFSQLVYRSADGSSAVNEVIEIVDYPRFQYRGVMIDSSRHFLSINTIFAHLDAMSYSKFNVLHWHIVDDQSFPYDSVTFPNLSLKGAYDHTHVYTQEDISHIITYAKERGIRVVPEFDTPGHTQSWGKGQPDFLTPCYSGSSPNGEYGPVNPIEDATWTFLSSFFTEVAGVFPDTYLHLGGDEVDFSCCTTSLITVNLKNYYEQRLLTMIGELGKQYVIWQEPFDNGVQVLPATVIDVWKGDWQGEMKRVTQANLHAILSTCWYLNYISYGEDWPTYYDCDPQSFGGTPAENALVLGGHACLWAEFVDSTNFLSRMWPRAGAVGERLWSDQSVTDVSSARTRLSHFECRLVARGIPAEPSSGPSYCSYEWPDQEAV